MTLEHQDLTGRIIGAAIAVHSALGPGFIESVYDLALRVALRHRGIPFEKRVKVPIYFEGEFIKEHELDLLVDKLVVVELKAVARVINEHFAVVRSYLTATRLEHGLILNFSGTTLEIHRVFGTRSKSN